MTLRLSRTHTLCVCVSLSPSHRHVYDPSVAQGKLKPDKQYANIQRRYEMELIPRISAARYAFRLIELDGRRDVKATICRTVDALQDDIRADKDMGAFFVCGVVGKESADGSPSVLGSTNDLALRSVHVPVIIIQREPRKKAREFLFLVGTDLEGTHKAYEITANVMKGGDTLEVLRLHDPEEPDAHLEEYRKTLVDDIESRGLDARFTSVDKTPGVAITTQIVDLINDRRPDFVVMVPRSNLKFSPASVSERCIRNCQGVNFILVKF